jgi:hypothetical protein
MWNVEYWHHNSDGELLTYGEGHNTVTGIGVEAGMERLIQASLDLGTQTDAAGLLTEANTWDQIALLNTNAAGDSVTDGILAASILDLVDGGTAQNENQVAGGAITNPADGAFSDTTNSTTDGKAEVTLKFLADGDPGVASQMVLGKFAVRDNQGAAGAALAAEDILAAIDISVNLANTDTLTITWTIDINP